MLGSLNRFALIAATLMLSIAGAKAQTTINFDTVTDGTTINNGYAGITFRAVGSPYGTNVYARTAFGPASSPNVVTLVPPGHGLALFDRRQGGVEVEFANPVARVSLLALPVLPPEFLTTPTNKPFLQAFDASRNFLGAVYYPLNYGQTGYGTWQALTLNFPDNRVKFVQFSSQYTSGPAVYGLFDNLSYVSIVTARLTSLSLSSIALTGGKTLTGTVTLSSAAPAGGAVVALSSSNTAGAVPASVTVAEGQKTATFNITTVPVNADTELTIGASYSGVPVSAPFTVKKPKASAFTLSAGRIKGGLSLKGTVTLAGAAASAGINVALTSSSKYVIVPASVKVSAGSKSVTFTISTKSTTTLKNVTLTATAGLAKTATLIVTP